MSDTDWIVECIGCQMNFEGAEMIPLGDGEWMCEECLCPDDENKEDS